VPEKLLNQKIKCRKCSILFLAVPKPDGAGSSPTPTPVSSKPPLATEDDGMVDIDAAGIFLTEEDHRILDAIWDRIGRGEQP